MDVNFDSWKWWLILKESLKGLDCLKNRLKSLFMQLQEVKERSGHIKMLNKFFDLIRQKEYIEFLKTEISTLRGEKAAVQDTLNHVLRIHLIPKEVPAQVSIPTPIQVPPRNMRERLNDIQRKSWESARERIEQVEKEISNEEDRGAGLQ